MNINRDEVLRYLGYKNQVIDDRLDSLIDSCIEEIKNISMPLITFKIFETKVLKDEIHLSGCNIALKGQDIFNHLKDSKKCAILAVSLGISVDNRIRYLNKVDVTRALILDACSSEAVESLRRLAEDAIRNLAVGEGMGINYSYSPGYGDFSIDIQPQILNILKAGQRIGISCTEDFLLLPRKSVTAIIGFVEKGFEAVRPGCSNCNAFESCLYRRDGINCGF